MHAVGREKIIAILTLNNGTSREAATATFEFERNESTGGCVFD